MKLTKKRLHKVISNRNKQTRKKFDVQSKKFKHSNTYRNKKPFNLHNKSIKQMANI